VTVSGMGWHLRLWQSVWSIQQHHRRHPK
jgi:hypothetical protein